jgi:Domain of unknown function (DUF4375)
MREAGRAILLVVLAMLAVSCGGRSAATHGYLVPRGDRHVLDHTYDAMLSALERNRANDPADILGTVTPGQRMLYTLFFVDDEIGNGGLYQVFWNLRGGFVEEAIRDANSIGANHWAGLVLRARQELFPGGVPDDLTSQRKAIGCPDYCGKRSLDRLDPQWRDGELRGPLLRYVRRHPAEFYSG